MKKTTQTLTILMLTAFVTTHAGWFGSDDDKKQSKQQNNKTYTLKLAETWPNNFPILGDAVKKAAKLAFDMSNGRLIINIDSKIYI